MRFNRCSICDYVENEGSDLTNKSPQNKIKVNWSSKYNEYQCTLCRAEIKHTVTDYNFRRTFKKNGTIE